MVHKGSNIQRLNGIEPSFKNTTNIMVGKGHTSGFDTMLNTHGMWITKYDKRESISINKYVHLYYIIVTLGLHIPSGPLDFGECSHSTPTFIRLGVQQKENVNAV